MALLAFRRDRLDRIVGDHFSPASTSTVVVYLAGAQVQGNQGPGSVFNVLPGHYFPSGSGVKLCVMRYSGGLWALVANSQRSVASSGRTTVTISGSLTLLDGDYLVNVGADTGSTTPIFNGSTAAIFSSGDPAGVQTSQSRVTPNSQGEYLYWPRDERLWEVILSGSTPQELRTEVVLIRTPGAVVSVKDFGARGDGVTDDAAAIQAAIDYIGTSDGNSIGGEVSFPAGNYIIKSTISLKAYVALRGANFSGVSDTFSVNNAVTITAASPFVGTAMFNTAASSQFYGIEVNRFRINANGIAENGIVLDGTKEARLFNLSIQETTKSAVWLVRPSPGIGLETRMFNVNCTNCNLSAAGSRRGVIHVSHTDCFIQNCRAHMGDNTAYSSSGNRCGVYVDGNANFFSDCYADFNEDGWVVAAPGNQFVNCRGDVNAGHGWVVTSAVNSGTAVGCFALNNSQATTNTYDGFNSAASRFVFSACQVFFSGVTNVHRYAYNQTSTFGADNRWIGCNALPTSYGTALWHDTNQAGGWEYQNAYLVSSADDTTPSVKNVRVLSVGGNNTLPTTITQLDDGAPMQTVMVANFNSTNYSQMLPGGNLQLSGGPWTPASGEWIQLHTFNGTTWYEVARGGGSLSVLSMIDGVTAPGTVAGRAQIYVDAADGDAKIKFGDGAVVIARDVGGTLLSTGGNVTAAITVPSNPTNVFPAGRTQLNITNTTSNNTMTLEAPSGVDGQIIVLRCVALGGFVLTLANSGNVDLNAAWVPAVNGTLTLIASGVLWHEIGRRA